MTTPGRAWAVATVTAVLAAGGCTAPDTPPAPVAAEADLRARVNTYAADLAAVAGADLKTIGVSLVPCDGRRGDVSDTVNVIAGHYQVFIPQHRHAAVITQIKQRWSDGGLTIVKERALPNGPSIRARSTDDYILELDVTQPPEALALGVSSPCFQQAG